ncbi:MAG: ABC transporter permease [Microthrixaceae bacterium]|nr:ABC transporter permease [Microthrixaceae bacterium]
MDKFLIYTIAGLSTAAIYAIAASGLVVTYTTSGIFNFAHGAFSMMAAFMFWQLNKGWGLPFWVSVFLVIFVVAPLFGTVVERVLMRGIEGTTEVVKIVVTISLMIGLIALAQFIWPPSVARPSPAFFPGKSVHLFGVAVSYQRILSMIIAILIAVGLRLVFKVTRLGIAMRAVVDDRHLLQLNGGRPGRTSALAWSLGAMMAAISGVLIASEQSLSATGLTLIFINAYAVAVVGRLKSLPGAFLGSLILGLAEAYAVGYIPSDASIGAISLQKLPQAVPGIMLLIVILLQPQSRLRAHGMARRSIPAPAVSQRTAMIGGICMVAAVAAIGSLMAPSDLNLMTTGFYLTIVTMSLVPLTGYAGQISLAQLSFTGIGAVTMAAWGANGSPIGVFISIGICAAVGAVVAFPALRLSGIYLALATAAFAMICSAMVFNQNGVMPGGNRQVPRLALGPFKVDSDFKQFVTIAIVFAVAGNILIALRRSAWGRRLAAMRDSEVACATLGLNLTSTKVGVFALSAAIAGLAGTVSGGTFVAETLTLPSSLSVTMLAVVGGIGSVVGAFIGGLLLGAAPIGASVFSANAVGIFSFVSLSVPSLISFAPALMGLSLGREPDGAAPQLAVGFREVGKSPISLAIAAIGASVVWLAAWTSVIENWGFFSAGLVLALALVPLLPGIFSKEIDSSRRIASAAWLLVALVAAAFIPWGTAIESNGMRFVAIIAFVLLVGRVAVAAIGYDPTVLGEKLQSVSPDMIGIDEPITRAQAIDAVSIFGVTEDMLPPTTASTAWGGRVMS